VAKVVWSRPSLTDVQALLAYATQQQREYGDAFVSRLLDAADSLGGQPFSGWKVSEYDRDDIRELFVRPYRLIYLADESTCVILAVVHASRNLADLDVPDRFGC